MAPKAIKPAVRHFENAADIGGLCPIEEEIGLRRIRIAALALVQHAQCHQAIEEIMGAAWMQIKPGTQGFAIERSIGESAEHAEFDGAEKGLGAPKTHTERHDPGGREGV